MAEVKIFNVGHGDAIEIQLDNGKKIIRDLGRSRYAQETGTSTGIARLTNPLNQQCLMPAMNRNNIEAILSHAHEDHFTGFLMMHQQERGRIFESAYIPWIDYQTIDALGGKMLLLSLYLIAYYGFGNAVGRRAKNWILMIPVMYELSRNLYGVSAGYNFAGWNPNGQVLWPPQPGDFMETNSLNMITKEIGIIEEQDSGVGFVREFREEVFTPLFNLISGISPLETNTSYQEGGELIFEQTERLINASLEYKGRLKQRIRLRNGAYAHTRNIDNHSIVFKIFNGEENHALFLSDLHPACINRIVNGNIPANSRFNLIKSSHHGSRIGASMYRNNIKANMVIHCCGPTNRNWWGPNHRYNRVSTDIRCTDWKNNSPRWENNGYNLFQNCCDTIVL